MELDLDVEGEKFRVSVGKGFGDFVWLACYGAKLYGGRVYPKGNYLPLLLRIESQGINYVPHPRKKIHMYFQESNLKPQNLIIQIPIRKANQAFGENETRWQKQAFGQERNLMDLRMKYFADKLNRKKEFYFAVELVYSMYDEVKQLYDETEYKPVQQIPLVQKILGPTQSEFEASLTLPLGSLRHTLLYYSKEDKNQDFKCTRLDEAQLRQNSKNIFTVEVEPSIPSQDELQEKVREDMKIQQNLSKALQEKEQQSKKKGGSATLCCYTFEQLWAVIESDHEKELSLKKYEESTNQRVKIVLQKHLTKLYEIFFYYFIIYNQQKEKREDLVITYQDVMHFLKFYELLKDSTTLFNFFDFYNTDNKIKNVSDTLDLNNGVTFPHFIAILLKATQFIQTSSLMMEGETFDQSVAQVINKVLQIENNDDEFGFFHRNIREHTKLIAFIREHSLELANIFIEQIQNGTQTSQNNYHLLREELKVLLGDCGFEGNHDNIVNECFIEFFGSKDKYRKFEGIFFYEFIQVIQWLAMVLVRSNHEEDEDDDGDEEILVLIEKIKFFIGKLTEHK